MHLDKPAFYKIKPQPVHCTPLCMNLYLHPLGRVGLAKCFCTRPCLGLLRTDHHWRRLPIYSGVGRVITMLSCDVVYFINVVLDLGIPSILFVFFISDSYSWTTAIDAAMIRSIANVCPSLLGLDLYTCYSCVRGVALLTIPRLWHTQSSKVFRGIGCSTRCSISNVCSDRNVWSHRFICDSEN